MALLPTQTATKVLLDQITIPRNRGKRVGMGSIGDPCARRLWFGLHWAVKAEEISLSLHNLFNTGTRAEDFIIEDLERIGIKVTQRQERIWGFMKHALGFIDGRCTDVPEALKTEHLLEIKTHNDKNFKILFKDKVKKGFPKHYAQVQRCMKGTKLTRCLYIGYNKNNSEYYVERVRYDPGFADDLIRKEQSIIAAPEPPVKIFERSWFECKFCPFIEVCHDGVPMDRNCRTCEHSDLADEGVWTCNLLPNTSFPIPLEVQKVGCDHYKRIEVT